MNAAAIRQALACGRPGCACARSRNTHCPGPAHTNNDADPSLTVDDKNGSTLWNCKRGCSQLEIAHILRERGLLGEAPGAGSGPVPIRGERLAKEYEFRDASGAVRALHGRFETVDSKTFRWRTPNGDWKDGLGFPESDLPLYNLSAVLGHPDARVWFVEGEKAADACIARGLVAVSLPGGAAQQRFGNALDPLLDRDVALWPDNDEAGRALMQRVAGYLPGARSVTPAVGPKADAYDYFASGGTIEALEELLTSNDPTVRIVGSEQVIVDFPVAGGLLSFAFADWTVSGSVVRAALQVTSSLPGQRSLPYETDLNLGSASTREGVRRELEQFFGVSGKDSPWSRALSYACSAAAAAWKSIDASIDLRDVALPTERRYLVDRFLPEKVGSILFGMGGSGKSMLGASLLLHALHGAPWLGRAVRQVSAAMVIDYEDSEDEWRLRVQQLADGAGLPLDEQMFRYLPGRGIPVYEQRGAILRLIDTHRIGFVVVDSAASASGGDLLDVAAAAKLTSALTEFGRHGATSALIAHNTKAQESMYPYGNIMWHNLVRATHYVESFQAEGSSTLDLLLWNRKANRGLQRPISARLSFPASDTGALYVQEYDMRSNEVERGRKDGDLGERVLVVMEEAGGQCSTTHLVAVMGLKPNHARSLLGRLSSRGQITRAGIATDRSTLWGLTTRRLDASEDMRTSARTSETPGAQRTAPPPPSIGGVSAPGADVESEEYWTPGAVEPPHWISEQAGLDDSLVGS